MQDSKIMTAIFVLLHFIRFSNHDKESLVIKYQVDSAIVFKVNSTSYLFRGCTNSLHIAHNFRWMKTCRNDVFIVQKNSSVWGQSPNSLDALPIHIS